MQNNVNLLGDVSPTQSASPVPAPPPLPPLARGCSHCRIAASTASLIARSRPDLVTDPVPSTNINMHHGVHHTNYDVAQTGSFTVPGYDYNQSEEDDTRPAILDHELHMMHRNIPALRRAGIDTNTIKQHFYPDGGWGWIVCGVAFLAHVLTTGFQLSYGLLQLYVMRHLGKEHDNATGWLGAASWSISLLSATIVISLCRLKSTRLTAVLGGLTLALGILFASFATQLHQVAFSYCVIVGIGSSMVRESAAVMIGNYFKRRRQFVEMITMSGEGVGVALFSVILKEGVGKMGWRLGLQAVTGLVSLSFFMALLYRPASLYHPQRRAILHLKNQRKKVKEKKTHIHAPKPPFIDFSPIKSSTVRMLMIIAAVAGIGIYTPIFNLSIHGFEEGFDMQDLVLLQTFVGLSLAIGIVASGSSINKTFQLSFRTFKVSRQYVCQGCVTLIILSMLILSAISGYRGLCIVTWFYGLGLGGYRFSLKMLVLERVRGRYFSKAWGFIKGAECIPVLLGIPLATFLNDCSPKYGRAGYYVCSAAAAIAAVLMFFIGYNESREGLSKVHSVNGSVMSRCNPVSTATTDCNGPSRSFPNARCGNWHISPYRTMSNNFGALPSDGHYPHYPQAVGYPYAISDRCRHYPYYRSNVSLSAIPTNAGVTAANTTANGHGRLQKSLSFAFQTPTMMNESFHPQSCVCRQQRQSGTVGGFSSCTAAASDQCYSRCAYQQHSAQQQSYQYLYNNHQHQNGHPSAQRCHPTRQSPTSTNLQYNRSRSVPEGLAQNPPSYGCHWNHCQSSSNHCRPAGRPVHVVEQITTSV